MDYAILLQAEQHCSLSHTLALWRLMALERAKIKSRNKQVRFEVILFILMVLIFDLCNFRHFFWNFSLIAFVRLRIKRTTATSFKVWLVFLCALHEMYTLTLPQGHQSVVLILKVWLVVFKLVRPTLKQTLFGNFFSGAFWAIIRRFQGRTWLKRKGQPESRVAKNRYGHISAAATADYSSKCEKRWRNDFDDDVRRAFRNVPFYNASIK